MTVICIQWAMGSYLGWGLRIKENGWLLEGGIGVHNLSMVDMWALHQEILPAKELATEIS